MFKEEEPRTVLSLDPLLPSPSFAKSYDLQRMTRASQAATTKLSAYVCRHDPSLSKQSNIARTLLARS